MVPIITLDILWKHWLHDKIWQRKHLNERFCMVIITKLICNHEKGCWKVFDTNKKNGLLCFVLRHIAPFQVNNEFFHYYKYIGRHKSRLQESQKIVRYGKLVTSLLGGGLAPLREDAVDIFKRRVLKILISCLLVES